ncbi:MAG: type II toxin-antitoxin system VapC family toxin, partial [Acidobacteria bacterium]|nr:type II toxin-antitoxin system VapC family toxin [Acidobacteriota bacterium]
MIAVDTSALMAILLGESEASACANALATNDRIVISAATVAEAMIVAERRNLGVEMVKLVDGLGCETVAVTLGVARRGGRNYAPRGKGLGPPRRERGGRV